MFVQFLQWQGITLQVEANDHAVTAVRRTAAAAGDCPNAVTARCCEELTAYFAGELRAFTVPTQTHGTVFQETVWQALRAIPYGETRSYGQIAAAIGRPTACRAVAQAIGRNPLLIFNPCHRVIGMDGSLTGFSAGLDLKKLLLRREDILC